MTSNHTKVLSRLTRQFSRYARTGGASRVFSAAEGCQEVGPDNLTAVDAKVGSRIELHLEKRATITLEFKGRRDSPAKCSASGSAAIPTSSRSSRSAACAAVSPRDPACRQRVPIAYELRMTRSSWWCHTAMNTPRVRGRNTYQPTEIARYATHRPTRQSRSVADARIEEILPCPLGRDGSSD